MRRTLSTSDHGAAATSSIGALLVSLYAIGLGTIAAAMHVPDYVWSAEAAFEPSLYMTLGLLASAAIHLRSNLSAVLRGENVLMVAIVYWLLLDLLQSAYPLSLVGTGDVQMAFVAIGCFAAAIRIGAAGKAWRLPRLVESTASRSISKWVLFNAMLLSFVLGMAKYVVGSGFDPAVMLEGLGANRWDAPWSRGALGGWDAFVDHMSYFGYVIPALCVLIAGRFGWLSVPTFVSIVLSLISVAFLAQAGGRRLVGVVVGAAIFTWVTSKGRLSLKLVVGGAAGTAAALAFMQEMLRYRNVGFGAWWAGERPAMPYAHLSVDDNFLRLAQLIMIYPEQLAYALHKPLYHALMLPIPRVLWPGKPVDPGYDLPGFLGLKSVSLSSSIVGELYVSFGLVAVVLGGFVLGRLAGMWNRLLALPGGESRPLLFGLGLMTLFVGMRSAQALVQMSYMILAWLAVSSLVAK